MLGYVAFVVLSFSHLMIPPQSAEYIVRAAARKHGFPVEPSADMVAVVTGTRSDTYQGLPMTVEYTRITKGEEMFREDQRLTVAGQVFRREIRFDGKAGWARIVDADGELSEDMTPEKVREHQQRKSIRASVSPEQLLEQKGIRLERLKDELIAGAKAYVVRITRDGEEVSTIHVDQKTLLLVKATIVVAEPKGKKCLAEQSYSDFRCSGGCMIPMKVEMRVDGKWVFTDAMKSVEFKPSKDYPDSMFRKPKQ